MHMKAETEILGRVLAAKKPNLSAAAARSILQLGFPAEDRDRVNQLSEKARKGTLTRAEDQELEAYISVDHLLAIIKSKARRSLKPKALAKNGRHG